MEQKGVECSYSPLHMHRRTQVVLVVCVAGGDLRAFSQVRVIQHSRANALISSAIPLIFEMFLLFV